MVQPPPLCQVAFSVTDLARTHRFYRDAFGFLPSGGTKLFRGPLASRIQGLPGAASTCWWLMDRQDFLQLEFFEFIRPTARPKPDDWRPCDVGYTTVGLHVADFDATLDRLDDAGVKPLTQPMTFHGARRVCIRDPEGVLLELMEDEPRAAGRPKHPRPEVPVSTRFVRLSVPNLGLSRRFFVETLGLTEAIGAQLHEPRLEALWGLDGARTKTLLLWAGDFLLELVQYQDPAGKPWPPGYRISDQGLLNIAFGFRKKSEFNRIYKRVLGGGYTPNWRPFNLGAWAVVYVNDDQGFSVELLFCRRWYDRFLGFTPKG